MDKPRVLIEEWLPIAELGVESKRENTTGQQPPPNRLHVWWARRPLTVSRAAILASLLPAWSANWPNMLLNKFPNREQYCQWFLNLIGILGDPIAARARIEEENRTGVRTAKDKYGYRRAFTYFPPEKDIELMQDLLEFAWGERGISVIDPMAGGGSIPLEALCYGFTVRANELNPVATTVLTATLDYPARYGEELVHSIEYYGDKIIDITRENLSEIFPYEEGETLDVYLYARTVTCPTTGKPVPLSPNWWLSNPKKGRNVAVRMFTDEDAEECCFEIVEGDEVDRVSPNNGTVSGGNAVSPWTGESIGGDYIKAEAQSGRMGYQLYAVSIERDDLPGGKGFRLPNDMDLEGIKLAEEMLKKRMPSWEKEGFIPFEQIVYGAKTSEPLNYGMNRWCDMFSARQLLVIGTLLEAYTAVCNEIDRDLDSEKARAVKTYLAMIFDKCYDRNSFLSSWIPQRAVIRNVFDEHNFSFKWTFCEMVILEKGKGWDWASKSVIDAYKGISKLTESLRDSLFSQETNTSVDRLHITNQNAMNLSDIPDASYHLVCVDPPYYAQVMYAELSDYFYVWMKRTLGEVYPEYFTDELTNKDDEAVANNSRFEGTKRKRKAELAELDYQSKMAACFKEMNRILSPAGVLTVMFTHKEVKAWNTLATALIEAGFTIVSSWPVHTESETSLHQANKNAAASTILLVCRKRDESDNETIWWDDIRDEVRKTARQKAEEFEQLGIRGVDLYISTFGPTLSIISQKWPVLTSESDDEGNPKILSPDTALTLAREEVVSLRKKGLLLGRDIQFDTVTDWYIMAWDTFQAREFPSDEAIKFSHALGLSFEGEVVGGNGLVGKRGKYVSLKQPSERRQKNVVDPRVDSFSHLVNAVHTAMMVFTDDGSYACERFLKEKGLLDNQNFLSCFQALLNAVPRVKSKEAFTLPEANTLEAMRLAFFTDFEPPKEPEPALRLFTNEDALFDADEG